MSDVRSHFLTFALVLFCVLASGCGTGARESSGARGSDRSDIPLDAVQPQPAGIIGTWVEEPVDPQKGVYFYYWLDGGQVETECILSYADVPVIIRAGRYTLTGGRLEFGLDRRWDGSQWHPEPKPMRYWTINVRGDTMSIYEYGSTGGAGRLRRVADGEIADLRAEVGKHGQANKANLEAEIADLDAQIEELRKR